MTAISTAVPADISGKDVPIGAVTEIPKTYSLDGIEDEEAVGDSYHGHRGFTRNDNKDMNRMGKKQELRRIYRPLSALAFVVIVTGTWEFLLVANTQGLTDGGLAGLFWSFIWTLPGFSLIMLSLAEMASMAPTSGGQYHWVSEFAPPQYQKVLSYITGWLSSLSWQAGSASGPFLVGTIIQALIGINNPDYVATNWQGTLLVVAMVAVIFVANVWGAQAMPMIQNFMLLGHIFGFLTIVITLWILSPRATASDVFTLVVNRGGWSSDGVSLMVGQVSAMFALIGSDAAAHMAEEIKDAGITVPRAMFQCFIMNSALGLVLLITYLFCIPSVDDALNDPTLYPFLYVFKNAVSTAGVNALTALLIVLIMASNISYNMSTSRQLWSFARDNGVPFAKWISRVDSKLEVPVNAVMVSCLITILLALINLGSSTAITAIISLNLSSLMLTYVISICCVLHRRIHHPELLPSARWSLGRWGIPINIGAAAYAIFSFFWSFWPMTTPVTLTTFNWSSVIFMGVCVLSLVWYSVRSRKTYTGPVVLIEGWQGSGSRSRH